MDLDVVISVWLSGLGKMLPQIAEEQTGVFVWLSPFAAAVGSHGQSPDPACFFSDR
jgi:hypothetical protein